jgi:acetoin utilization deacetylase AcuC-like enzyme
MTCTVHVAWDERLTDYHFGPGHPLAPVRVELTMRLAHEFGLWAQPGVTVAAPAPATDADLELVHDPRCVANVKTVSRWAEHPDARGGLEETQLGAVRCSGWAPRTPDHRIVQMAGELIVAARRTADPAHCAAVRRFPRASCPGQRRAEADRAGPAPAAGVGCAGPRSGGWQRSGRGCGCGWPVVILPWTGA